MKFAEVILLYVLSTFTLQNKHKIINVECKEDKFGV